MNLEACAFCGKARSQVLALVTGPGVCICNECVDLCNAVLDGKKIPRRTYVLDGAEVEEVVSTDKEPETAAKHAAIADHAYLSAGDAAGADGDRAHAGCYLCGRSRREHAS